MKAVVLSNGKLSLESVAVCEPKVGEAKLSIVQVGICNTDVELARGYKGFSGIIGHEFVAKIEQINVEPGNGMNFAVGQRVVAEINCVSPSFGCKTYHERAQHPERAALGIFKHDGAMTEYVCVPLENLHAVPAEISDDQAMFAEPLAAACQILQQVEVKASDEVLVLGAGKLGILIAQVLRTTGCQLTVAGRRAATLAPLQARGIPACLVTELPRLGEADKRYDVVVECTGNASGLDTALRRTRPCGTLVLKSTFEGLTPADLTKVVVDEIRILGSRCGPFDVALRLLREGKVTVDGLITHRYTLAQGLEAMAMAASKESLKVAIRVAADE